MIHIQHRDKITDLLKPNSVGCELGVFEGDFSEKLLLSGKFNKLYLVDLFSGQAYNFGKVFTNAEVLYDVVSNRFSQNKEVIVIKQDSILFLKSIDIKFDFIYIDTLHSYDHLIQELEAARNVVEKDGYICGHDYCKEFSGVIEAVKEFSQKYQYNITVTQEEDKNYPSFILNNQN